MNRLFPTKANYFLLAILLNSFCLLTPVVTYAEKADELQSIVVTDQVLPFLRYIDATIEAENQATVSAQVSGRIIELPFDVDDYVKKGQVIVRFRDKEQRAAVKAAQANMDEAKLNFDRISDIYRKKLVAKAELDRASARLKSLKAKLDQTKEALENTLVRAPYSGIVVKRHVEVGELAREGKKLMTGLSLEKLRASAQAPQSVIHAIRENKQAWVWVGEKLQTKVMAKRLTISPYADPDSHTFAVRVYLPDGDHRVYPGMHTKIGFVTGTAKRLLVPRSAVVKRGEVTALYIKGKHGIVMRQIRTGREYGDGQIEILSGLSNGETVFLDPHQATLLLSSGKK